MSNQWAPLLIAVKDKQTISYYFDEKKQKLSSCHWIPDKNSVIFTHFAENKYELWRKNSLILMEVQGLNFLKTYEITGKKSVVRKTGFEFSFSPTVVYETFTIDSPVFKLVEDKEEEKTEIQNAY